MKITELLLVQFAILLLALGMIAEGEEYKCPAINDGNTISLENCKGREDGAIILFGGYEKKVPYIQIDSGGKVTLNSVYADSEMVVQVFEMLTGQMEPGGFREFCKKRAKP